MDPQARVAVKNKSNVIRGYKTQNLCTEHGVILGTRIIPANEHDRDAMCAMTTEVQTFFHTTPRALLGDTAYGHGKQRRELSLHDIEVIAPVVKPTHPGGLYDNTHFTYDSKRDVYRCPNQKETVRKNHNAKLSGWQYFFNKEHCAECTLRPTCTTNKTGRSLFRSDYADLYERARTFNESNEGRVCYQKRLIGERKNNELKNHCGLGKAYTRKRSSLQIKAHLSGMVVNLKHTIRKLVNPKPGFLRRTQCITTLETG